MTPGEAPVHLLNGVLLFLETLYHAYGDDRLTSNWRAKPARLSRIVLLHQLAKCNAAELHLTRTLLEEGCLRLHNQFVYRYHELVRWAAVDPHFEQLHLLVSEWLVDAIHPGPEQPHRVQVEPVYQEVQEAFKACRQYARVSACP